MTAEDKLRELEKQGKTCKDCGAYDICKLPKEPICSGYRFNSYVSDSGRDCLNG